MYLCIYEWISACKLFIRLLFNNGPRVGQFWVPQSEAQQGPIEQYGETREHGIDALGTPVDVLAMGGEK
jgi:hypothetical protein